MLVELMCYPHRSIICRATALAHKDAVIDPAIISLFGLVSVTWFRGDFAFIPYHIHPFSESYHKDWIAYVDGREVESHLMANGYANAWYMNKTDTFEIILNFLPQKLFYIGSAISLTTFIFCVFYISKDKIEVLHSRYAKKKSNTDTFKPFFG